MSAVVVRFPRDRIVRPKYMQKAVSSIARKFRSAHPGQADRWYWDLVRIFQDKRYTLTECLRRDDSPVLLAHSWAMIRKAKGGPDTYEVIGFPIIRARGDVRGQHGGRG